MVSTFITSRYWEESGTSWMESCHLLVELNGISAIFGFLPRIPSTEPIMSSQHFKSADSEASPAVSRFKIGPFSPARNTARLQRAAIRPRLRQVLSSWIKKLWTFCSRILPTASSISSSLPCSWYQFRIDPQSYRPRGSCRQTTCEQQSFDSGSMYQSCPSK